MIFVGFKRWMEDITMMIGNKRGLKYVLAAVWCFITPALLVVSKSVNISIIR